MKTIESSAPQNGDIPNRGADIHSSPRITLAEFAKGRQVGAAGQLGITQQALNTALKLGRNILVKINADGTATGFETKLFPSATRRKRQ
ncbi:Cro/CI family transcriptional regulator [Pseudomonas petrae]|uniref:Cro/CI family transcriptional regulator n=1 Tax=Pseudomonas petrae TaxID=2912190 RepID=A0ABS9HYH4_9PSED|nr:Cro/CI family transcriptional regulator [Pseudomonas petrae]MCF7540609.1 Cro/CI family transcriptional regulator [Pseudomonas petrae]